MQALAILALLPAGATLYFALFWRWFDFWRRHRVATYVLMFATLGAAAAGAWLFRDRVLAGRLAMPIPVQVLGAVAAGAWLFRDRVLAGRLDLPIPVQVLGWVGVAAACIFGTVADRQIGFRVRSFAPFFDDDGRIELVTTGAYGVVRHPIYASGLWFQLGAFLVTGHPAVAAAMAVFGLGAVWFTRQEERRLVTLLADPSAYDRYRARVPALLPWPRPRG